MQRDGLNPPAAVQRETASYFDNQDLFQQWLDEECIAEPGNDARIGTSAELFKSWSAYVKAAGDVPGTRKAFARTLERRGFVQCRQHGGVRAWKGVQLKPQANNYHNRENHNDTPFD